MRPHVLTLRKALLSGWLPFLCPLIGHRHVAYNPWLPRGRSLTYCAWCGLRTDPAIAKVVVITSMRDLTRNPDGSYSLSVAVGDLEPGEMASVRVAIPRPD